MRVDQDRDLGLAKHINESRRDNHAVRVNRPFGLRPAQKANGGDSPIANADIAGIPGRTGAVNDVPVADDEVVRGGLGVQRGKGQEEQSKVKKFGHDGRL